MKTQAEWVQQALEALENLNPGDSAGVDLLSYLYVADGQIGALVGELEALGSKRRLTKAQRQRAGRLMEAVAYLAFRGLKGCSSFKSFQSAGPQYDLLVTGDGASWLTLARLLYMTEGKRGVLVEAKGTSKKIADKDFARVCAIMETNLPIVGLGVFFSLHGATGFPLTGARQRGIRDCRLRQALFFAKTGRPVVVFDKKDISELRANGTLPILLARKIRDIAELGGLPTVTAVDIQEVDLPKHLKDLGS